MSKVSGIPPWAVVGLVCFCIRLWVVMRFTASPFLIPQDGDMLFYHRWALRVLGGVFSDGSAFYGLPGYPFLLAAFYKVLGTDFGLLALLQTGLETVTGVFVFLLARETMAPFSAGEERMTRVILPALAALGWACHTPAQAMSLIGMPTSWIVCAFWGVVWWAVRRRGSFTGLVALVCGLGIGLCTMMVATILALVPLLAATTLWSGPVALRARMAGVALLLAGLVAGTAPCWIHNFFYAKDPVLLSAHSGLNFYVGNHALANGYPRLPPELRGTQDSMLRDSVRIAVRESGRPLKKSEVSAFWKARADAWVGANRGAWFRLSLLKLGNFWNAFRYDDLSILTVLRENGVLPPGLSFAAIALLGLPGLGLALWCGNFAGRMVCLAVMAHMAVLLPVFVTERYRLPVVPGLLVLSVFFVAFAAQSVLRRDRLRMGAAVVVLALGAVVIFQPRDSGLLATHDLYNSGRAALALGKLDAAEIKLTGAAEKAPGNAEIQFSLGNLRLEQGRRQDAKSQYRKTVELDPLHDRAWNNLAVLAMEEGRLDLARQFIANTIALFPDDAKSHYLLALILEKMDRSAEALQAVGEAVRLEPEQPVFREKKEALEKRTGDGG